MWLLIVEQLDFPGPHTPRYESRCPPSTSQGKFGQNQCWIQITITSPWLSAHTGTHKHVYMHIHTAIHDPHQSVSAEAAQLSYWPLSPHAEHPPLQNPRPHAVWSQGPQHTRFLPADPRAKLEPVSSSSGQWSAHPGVRPAFLSLHVSLPTRPRVTLQEEWNQPPTLAENLLVASAVLGIPWGSLSLVLLTAPLAAGKPSSSQSWLCSASYTSI